MALPGFLSSLGGSLAARSLPRRSTRLALLAGAGISLGLVGLATPAQAFMQINVIGTGQNNPASTSPSTTLDANWKVASLPSGVTNTNTAAVGNSAYVVYQTPLVGGRCPWIEGGSPTTTPSCVQTGYHTGATPATGSVPPVMPWLFARPPMLIPLPGTATFSSRRSTCRPRTLTTLPFRVRPIIS